MTQLERIAENEARLDALNAACASLSAALDEYAAVQAQAKALEAYYGGEDWRRDFEDDEKGLLPASLKRGVLSEDAAYDALEENRALLARLLETAAEIIKGS